MASAQTPTGIAATSEMNVTPFLDVLLVLLITFMAMAMATHRTLDVQLPVPCTGNCAGDTPIVLEVGPGGQYRINQQPVAGDLDAALRGIYADRPDKILQVAGSPDASYQAVTTAIDIARGAGVQAVGIVPKDVAQR